MRVIAYTHAAGSGAGRYVAQLCAALSQEGTAVCLICPADFRYADDALAGSVALIHGPRSLADARGRLGKFWRSIVQAAAGAWLALLHSGRGQIVHLNFVGLPTMAVFVVLALRSGGRLVVLTVHDVHPHRALLPRRFGSLERSALKLLYRGASHLVVHYEAAASQLRAEFGIASGRISVIAHGADAHPLAATLSRQDGGPLRLLVLGTLREDKGIDLAIAAVQRLRRDGHRVELTIAGHAPVSELAFWQRCRAAIDAEGAGLSIHDRFLSDDEMEGILADADAVLLPYRGFTSQSGVAIAALAAGRPIIATAVGGLADLLIKSVAGIPISEATVPAVERAVLTALELGTEELAGLGSAGAAYVGRELGWRVVAGHHVTLYRRLAARS